MGAMPATQRMTADEFLALPEPLDARRVELVGGEVVVHVPTFLHQMVTLEILHAMTSWVRSAEGRGSTALPLDVLIDSNNIFNPDILWYAESKVPGRDAHRPYPIPQLAVEVRSPSTWRYDIGPKKSAYERAGLRELWLVDTAASEVLIFRRSGPEATSFDVSLELERNDTLTSPQLDGFGLPLAELFPE
jgi:Uma2 family endonuclease